MTDYEVVQRVKLAQLDDELQARWRMEHRVALAVMWGKRMVLPLASVVIVGMALYEIFVW